MSDSLHIVCPSCNSTNNLPAGRLGDHPKCGKCKATLFNAHPVELTGHTFDRHIQNSHIPVLVDFWAGWCGPCKMMAPVFEHAASEFEPRIRFAKVNTEAEQDLAVRYGIRSIPTIIIFKGGKEIARQPGAMDQRGLAAWIHSVL